MGNDGGSIPTRRELVKEAARNPTTSELRLTAQEKLEHAWNMDPLSHAPLAHPIVSDSLGRLFNKDAVLEFLLPPQEDSLASREEQLTLMRGMVQSLKDVVEVKFRNDPTNLRKVKNSTSRNEKWLCSITGKELGPATRAVYLVPCGHAFSETAIHELAGATCPECDTAFTPSDVIPILSSLDVDVTRLTLRASSLRESGLTHSLRKSSGARKKGRKFQQDAKTKGSQLPLDEKTTASTHDLRVAGEKRARTPIAPPNGRASIKHATTASIAIKVLDEQNQRNKKKKVWETSNIKNLFNDGSSQPKRAFNDIDFMNRGVSLQQPRR